MEVATPPAGRGQTPCSYGIVGAYTGRVGSWYWIGLAVGLGVALGVLCAGALASSRLGTLVAVLLAAGGGILIGLGLGEWGEAIGGAIGGVLGVGGSAQFVQGALRRGGTQLATAVWIALGALSDRRSRSHPCRRVPRSCGAAHHWCAAAYAHAEEVRGPAFPCQVTQGN